MSNHVAAELSVTAEHLDRYRQHLGDLSAEIAGGPHDDVIAAIHEAERSLRSAYRQLERAVKLLGH
jgi:hypothetical protein